MWEQFLNMIGMGSEPQAATQTTTPSAALPEQPAIGKDVTQATPEQEAKAKAAGFPSYQAQVLWSQQRERKRDKQTSGEKGGGTDSSTRQPTDQAAGQPKGHRVSVFQHVLDILNTANTKG